MTEEMPEVESFCESVARLHLNSVSPNNMYGFPLTTYMGPLPQDNTWCSTWEEYFKQGMVRMLDLERNVQGPSEKLERLTAQLFERVIPRLLRPLTVLKSIKPVLIHGDLWYGNCCTDNDTGRPIVFDACVQWAHNECELSIARQVLGRPLLTNGQTRLGLGERSDTDSARRISKLITSTIPFQHRKRTTTIVMRYIQC